MKFIDRINELCKNDKKIKVFLDMDGTIVEFIFDLNESFAKKGGYLKKAPIRPLIEQIKKINDMYYNIEIKILSCSNNNQMTKEKNEWLDINMPFIKKENRIFLNKENGEYTNMNINKVKSEHIKKDITSEEIAIFIDDDSRILIESQKILGNQVIPIHVTSLLI